MGAGNVKEAYVRWAHLPHAPFRLLAYMCVVANDGDEPRFWAGQEVMALALNLPVDTARERSSSFRTIRKHLETLCESKCIERTRAGAPGRNAEYTLRLSMGRRTVDALRQDVDGGPSVPSDVDGNGGHSVPSDARQRRAPSAQNGGHPRTQRRALLHTTEGTQCPPEEEEDHKRTRENEVETAVGRRPARARTRAPARTSDGAQRDAQASDTARCPDCGADHSGLTCDEYRRGDDKPPPPKRTRRKTS